MIKIYHNNRCRKSREVLQYLENKGLDVQIIEYMKNPLTAIEWKDLFFQIGKSPQEMIRTQEALWKNDYKDQAIDDAKLLDIFSKHPKTHKKAHRIKRKKRSFGPAYRGFESIYILTLTFIYIYLG